MRHRRPGDQHHRLVVRMAIVLLGLAPVLALPSSPDPGADALGVTPRTVAPVSVTVTGGVAAAAAHTCAIWNTRVWCSGLNSSGQLGNGSLARTIAFAPSLLDGATSVAAGGATTCAVRADRSVWCWGLVPETAVAPGSQSGVSLSPERSPVKIPLENARAVTVGSSHSCALLGDGSVWCWGRNSVGQLGDGTVSPTAVPVRARIDSVVSIDAGSAHTCAVRTDGTVWCWGSNLYHRLGQRVGSRRTLPTVVPGIRARNVSAGGAFTCAVTTRGGVACWGRNNYGQVGQRPGSSRVSPLAGGRRGIRSVTAGEEFACARSTSGVWCWGRNRDGQLADGTNKYRHTARRVTASRSVGVLNEVVAGSTHACAIATIGGSLWCWGAGTQGQLGDGSGSVRKTGVAIWPNGVQLPTIGAGERATIAAAGDIACDAKRRSAVGEGPLGPQCGDAHTAALIEANNPDGVLALGDLQYESSSASEFASDYSRTWGRLADRTYPVRGNHEYLTRGAAGYIGYFGAASPSYWWADAGGWRIIAIDSWCQGLLFAGCASGSPQTRWLVDQLARARADGKCAAVAMHHPISSSGRHGTDTVAWIWQEIVAGGADLVLAAHDHIYERFEPLDGDGEPAAGGVPLFISGLGGAQAHEITWVEEGSIARVNNVHGVLFLTLTPSGYGWRFLSAVDGAVLDSGSAPCSR